VRIRLLVGPQALTVACHQTSWKIVYRVLRLRNVVAHSVVTWHTSISRSKLWQEVDLQLL